MNDEESKEPSLVIEKVKMESSIRDERNDTIESDDIVEKKEDIS